MFIRAVIKQVLIDGFFHGDPHPGNLMADPEDKRLVFLDIGLVGQLTSTQRVDLLGLIYAVKEVDIPAIADGLIALGKPTPEFDEAQFRTDVDRLARQYLVFGGVELVRRRALGVHGRGVRQRAPARQSLTLAIKATVQAEETARALSPTVDVAEAAMTEAKAALLASLEPDRVQKQLTSTAARMSKELARRVPSLESAAFQWIDQFNKGKLTVELDTSQLTQSVDKLGGLGRQATVGLIVVGQLIGTAIAMVILLQPALAAFSGFAYVAMIAFAVTLLVSFYVLFQMLFWRAGDDVNAAPAGMTAPRHGEDPGHAERAHPGGCARWVRCGREERRPRRTEIPRRHQRHAEPRPLPGTPEVQERLTARCRRRSS